VASVFITRRKTRSGTRHVVRYRLGGRAYPIVHGGSFKKFREAQERARLIGGELAAGRNPALLLAALTKPPLPVETLRELAPRYEASRVDRKEGESRRTLSSLVKRAVAWGGDRDPHSLTWQDCQEFVASLSDLAAGSVRNYYDQFRLLLDFAGCDPNPARDKRVKLPRMEREEVNPPTGKQFLALLDKVTKRWRLPFVLEEQCGMHIGEVVTLAWGDVDVAECKIRLRFSNVKAGIAARARTVQVPEWLMDAIAASCPLEDRTAERKVFLGLNDSAARAAMNRACTAAGIPHFSPRISVTGERRSGITADCRPVCSPSGLGTPSRQ
jgi:integrase